jgi:hypothetical protein
LLTKPAGLNRKRTILRTYAYCRKIQSTRQF